MRANLILALLSVPALAWQYHTAEEVITKLNLTSIPEKGYAFQTFQDPATIDGNRSVSTAIYYLLEGSQSPSNWHVLDATEIWHFYSGAPLTVELSWNNGSATECHHMGHDVFAGQEPQVVVPAHRYQRAISNGNWTLVGTTNAPGFVESGFYQPDPATFVINDGAREGQLKTSILRRQLALNAHDFKRRVDTLL